ncbi:hypothetical protein ASPACDRAFT_37457 [Aspergillus aculeatus ATCC 16872]|uniref:Carrier domain-containing protein n=1 Tax=Aspergillus aculeatus (strain ATCC 16872 / CBS 172.66 / WB 5094) TaxID=690307 RepID=A0A1L9WEU6_ASPA1|nr:uncharacterized protein ASPACDRAFT_37457 [Aspergillus aculeatus ATCC 16872]OJJ94691.1 hypothetical protein ASPACDRAFT_37457 [Aspergillus aculeatus ATCC 16872]
MGDYGNQTSIEALPAQLPLELKASASLFPLLTDGILVDGDQTAGPAVAGDMNQARIALELKPHVSAAALAGFCTRQDVTLLSVLNVAWAMVLAAYADTDVVHVLSVRYVAEVPHVGLSEITIDDGSTVRQNLVELEQRLQASVAVPSATTVTDLQIWTSVDDHPAFNSVVLLSDGESPERVVVQAGNYIALQARAAQDQVAIHLQAPIHLLPEAQAKHCAATLSHVLGEIIQNPDRPLHAINLMSPSGLEQISHWNQTAPAVVSRCLHHIVDETAQARLDALAIDGADGQMTYAELQWYSDRLAQHLMQRGVGPETAVPLFFEKSKWAIVTMVAVVKAGGVIVNLDAKQPLPRLRGLLTQLQAQFVISSVQHATLWVDEYPVVVVSEDALAQLPTSEAVVPHLEVSPQNALYIIFTSGSTGTPKGVVVEHESFLTAAAQHVQAGQILPSSRVLQMTPYTFDVSMLEIFTTLTTGACICFCSDEEAARGITHIINFLQITWTFMTPSLVRLIDPKAVPTLKTLALGGEGLGRIDVTTWADKLQLINGYGPSECSVAATINTPLSLTSDPANIGVGYGANCWVVHPEDHHRLVPIGTVGELVIQGPIVARGYLHEPAKTAAVFLDETPDFAALLPQQPHAFRLYKTGDLVRQNSDGTFNFLGRKDRQVKLNGQRLELGEIEQRLSADALVRHALVMLPKEGPCQGRLVAVLSLHAFSHDSPRDANVHVLSAEESRSARASLPKITARLATQLPVYMIPTFWVVLAALPFTTSGKVHGVAMTKWLAEMSEETYNEIAGVSDEGSETALSSEVELQLQQIWADELGIPVADLKANRSFIALGGDSLTAMKVVARCRKQQLVVSVPDVLRAANIVELAARTTKGSDTSSGDDNGNGSDKMTRSTPAGRVAALNDSLLTVAGLTSRDQVEDVYGCSPMQDGILLSQVKFPGTYQVRRVLRVQSTGDVPSVVDRLQRAWQTVVSRHPLLRTIFVDAEGQFRQIVLKEVSASVQVCERLDLTEEQAVVQFLQDQPMPSYAPSDPQHHFTICHAAGDAIFLKFEISHALVDGASNEVILRELSQAFDVQDFPSPAALFGDYIEYISEAQAGSNNSLSHWTTYLAGVQPTIVPMYPPTEQQHAPKQIRSVPVPFTENQVAALVRLSEANGITLANVLQTAWALTLRAYTGFDDVCFGYIASGRDVPVAGIEHAVGAFINMLVCRVRLDQYPSVLEAVAGMQAEYFDALPHQHTSLAQIQNALKLSGMLLFNSIVSVQKEVTDQLLGEWSLSFQPLTEDDPTDFDLTVHIYMGKERAHLSIGYWSSLLSEGDAANLANTFSGAIDRILTQANSSASDLDLFTERDREQIFAWNQDEPVAAPGVVHEYIYARARQQPDAPAVCAWDGEYTYAELDQLSEKLAHHLAQLGAGPEVLIPHCFDKSRLAPVTMLAIMKSGSAGVGLSAAHPRSRIQDIVENCAARIAVVAPQHVSVVEGLVEHIVVLDEAFFTSLPAPTAGAQLPQAKPCNPAFVSFTSGSTGKPKGIVLEHGSLITSILAHGVEWEVNQSARVLQFSAYAFDASVSDTFTTLVGGGTICIPQEKERVDDLAGAINRLGVTWAFLTPRVLGLLSPETVPTLKTVVLGGEAISREDISRWTEALSIRIVYGPTECTIYSMGTEPLTADSDPANLGHAVGTRLWVTDPENTDRLLPVGCIGELIIEGPLVTRGYLNEPEKTKAAYLEDPVWLPKRASGAPRRFYKTSDLVRYYPNGDLRFIGRKDTQIKVRGQRVELGEIEHAILETMPGAVHITVDAVVLPPQTLVAFLYLGGHSDELMMPLTPEVTAQLRALEKSLSETLPSYMVPSLFIPISHIPMTISGKVDRIVLRRSVSTLSSAQLEMYALAEQIKAAPQTPQEIQLQKLWAKVLRKEASTVGRDDSFFRLGGNSIGAMKLVAAARGAGLVLSVADIFRHPQLSDMAAQLVLPEGDSSSSSSSSSPSSSTSPLAYTPFSLLPAASTTERENLLAEAAQQCSISLEAIEDVYPATPLQEGVFLMSTTHKGAYVAPTAFRISADFDLARFKAAWQTLVDAHFILRTRLVTVESTSYQVVLTKEASQLQWEHAASCDEYLARTQSLSVVAGDPLTRYALIPAEDHSTIFVWTAHHAVFDGWSVGLLFEQLVQLYKQQDGLALATPTGPSYAEFVQFLETKTDADASRKFWASLVPSEPPAIFPRLPAATYQPTAKATCFRTFSNIVQPEQSNLTLAILLRAAWAIVLARYTDAEDILYGLTLSGRDVPVAGVERMVGPTITTVPMNVHLDGEMLVETFLQQQQDQNIEMMRHQHAGLQSIRRISPAASAASDFTNLFVVQPHTDEAPSLEQMVQVTTDMSRFDPYALVLECNMKANGQVLLEARFDDVVVSSDQTQRLLGHFEHVLQQLTTPSTPDRRLKQVDMFSPEDERQIWAWNAEPAKPENVCVHQLVTAAAKRHPNHVAVDAWDGSLTYWQLDDMSSRLADWLISSHALKPESLVPLCFDKSLWTIVTMMAVVKCGGGCVMLNPDHPISRLEGVIVDTGSSVVLATPDRASLFASVAGVTVVAIDESLIRNLPVLDETVRPLPVIKPTNPVFVIFTSGSTGKPKGIVVQHNGVCTVAIQHGEGLGFTGKNLRVLQFASFSFDVSMGEVFITLMKGGTLCIPTEDDRINNLAATINLMNITWTFMAPTVAALLDPREVPNLQTLVLGGEAVSQSLVDQWSNQLQLIDSYGPAECTIWASHANASATVSPANIGRGVGCRYWVADIHDHNRLAPVGCVGELLIEGPNVSRGYLNEAEKTRDAFIESPAWMQGRADAEYTYKFYKTGDLVRYMADGSLEIAGRKDSQVKFHGQRIELGEIEFHLRASAAVEAGMVTLPKTGLCKGKLVAIVALTSLQPEAAEGDRVQLVLPKILQSPKTQSQIQEIQEELGAVLPPYMVPTIWVVLDSIPLTASRKINRVPISRWVMDMSEETYHQVVDATSSESDEQNLPSTALEKQLAQVWSHVLNLPLEAIGLNRSFLSLGGDSITAMQVVARCRSQGIDLSVQDILQPKSLAGVVARGHAAKPRSAVTREEVYDVPFELSPIQQLYFEDVVPANERQQHHYNQSVLLRVTHPISSSQLSAAIEKIVNCHAMLRARFHQDVDGKWTQLVRRPASGLAPVSVHDVTSREALLEVINASQRLIDIEQGPVFVVDYFTFPDSQGQLLSLIAHHLVVDAVSWHILVGQLEQLLLAPSEEFQLQCQMPFQSWAHAQREYAEGLTAPSLGPHALPTPNLSYWGLKRLPSWKDGEELTFNLDTSTTALLLAEANTSLRTQPVDLLVAALQQSFTESFPDRAMPAIFSEGHGREPWDTSIDLSETVGWFTVFQPIHRHVRQHESVKETVKRTKDARRACPDHGFAYFTGRQFRPAASERHDMEICFNYLGQAQHTERADAFLQEEPLRAGEVIDNIGEAMGRLAVFDVSAAVSHGRLLVSFCFPRYLQHQDRIRHWAESCQKVLQTVVTELAHSALEYSLSDFPLMAIDYADLSTLTSTVLPGIGLASDAVEDLYPCSSIQEGILISQARQPGTYEVRQLFEIVPRSDVGPVNVSHLLQAWQRIVDRHTILRTVFIESLTGAGVYDQLVLRSHQPNVLQLVYEGVEGGSIAAFIQRQPTPDYRQPVPAHRLTICEAPNKTVYCQLELSHALIDGTSMALLVRDLISGYENTLPATPAPLYHDYMAYLASRPEDEALAYWTDRLAEVQPCHFPDLQPALSSKEAFESHTIHIDREGRLKRFCEAQNVTVSNLFQAAWGLVLRAYTGHPEVCFGYMASGRDIPMAGIEEAVGPFINLLVCKLDVSDAVEVQELLQTVQSDYLQSLPHQQTSLAKIQHALGNHDVALFNTILSLQREPPHGPPPQLEFRIVDQVDPTEYDVDLNITTGDAAGVEVHLTYRTTMLSQIQANNLLQTFTNILLALTASADRRLSNLEIASTEENQPSRAIEQAWSTAAINGHATNLTALEQQVQVGLPVTQHAVLSIMRHRSTDKVAVFVIDRSRTPQTSSTSSTLLLPVSESQQQLFSELKFSLRAAQLPEPLLPSLFLPLNNLPLTHDYKVDREALQQLTSTLSELELQAYSLAPVAAKASRLTANEQLLADLWVEVLHLPDPQGVGPSDSFFRLGGDSIGAMRLVANARNQGLSLTMNTIFQQPTLSGMAKELRVLAPHEDRPLEPFSLLPTDVDVERLVAEAAQQCQIEDSKSIEDIYPCTPLQEGLMVLTSQDHTAYVVQEVFSLPGNVDLSRFQAAWEAVVARSTILRTRIINTPEGAFQVLLLEKGIAWESGADLSAYLARDSAQSMSYGQPLARYAILTTPEQNRYFVWTAHHAVYDGLTLPILAKQVSAEYNQEIALPEVPYNRFIDYIQGISSAAATEFWTTQCATPATTFPVLPGRSFQPTPDQTQHHSVSLTRSPSDITLPTVLRAAWAVVLAQRTESEHVSFGLTLSGRNAALAGINQVLGPTIATVPVHIQVRENQSPRHFLRAVQQQAIDMIPFEHTGLQNIRRMGDAAREAVDFQNLLLIQPASAPMDGSDFLGLTPVAVEKEQSDPYPLTVECNLLESGVEIKAQFDSHLISPAEMRSILQQYARTIERFNAVPEATDDENDEEEQTLDSMGTLSPEDLQQTLAWNANRPPYVNSCVHEQFEEQVRLRPDALAVSSFDVELTYRQLNVLVDSLATELLARGVRSEMKIPLCFTKCSWTIVAMFAVMKVGGVSCMFNPEHPSSRIQLLLDDLDARLVLCDPESAKMLSTLLPSEGVLPVDGDYLRSLPPATPLLLEGLVHPTNAVFVVYTSGSTGKPKGSILEHRSLVTGLLAHAGAMGIGPGTRTFQFAAYTFDVCFEEIIGSLMLGACICVPSEAERMNALADAMAKYRVTWTELTPTVASLLLPSSIPTLQTLALSGESLTQDVIQRWAGAVQIINTYGPSECCVSTTCNLHTATLRDPSNIGRGLGCTTWIVDPDNVDRLVPIGAVGELLVEGPIVARGYLNEPEKTAAAFISAPVWWPTDSYPSERIYRTGDLVKYNPDGTIKFIGRKDTQVKLHGQRIELGEIEHRLRAACADGDESSSHQVAVEVLTPKSRGGIKILTAFICESDAVADDNEEGHFLLPLEDQEGGRPQRFCDLQARLLAVLPRHMVPQLFIPVCHMPLSPSRKLERKRLRAVGNGLTPEQLASYALTQVAKTAPSTATETALADIWARVLGTSRSTIGVQDNFFHLGGDSIAAMKAVAAATKAGLPPLSVADITQSPTLSAMAASMDHASVLAQQAGGETAVPVGPAPFSLLSPEEVSAVLVQASTQCAVAIDAIEDIYPCTPSQEALMALTARDDTAYVSRSVYRLPLHLDLEKYRQAWELLAQRQAILRTRIVYSEDARSFQVVVREPLVWQELSADSVTAYVTRDQRLSMRHGQPLMRFALLAAETGDDSRPVLVHTAHHAVYDGWSEASMFAEAEAIYRHGLSSLPPVTPYNQFIHYLTTTVDPAACEAFWRTQLDGDLPALFPAPFPAVTASAATPRPNRSLSYRIDLTRTPSTPYSTPTILKAAWSLLLARYTTSDDVLFGHVLSGRTIPLPGVAEMMGPTIATVPVRVQLSRAESIDAFLRRLRDQAQAMAPFEQIGLQHLRRLAAEPIDLGHLFFIQPSLDSSDEELGLEPVTATDYEFETYPLIVECQLGATTDDDKLIVEVKYDDTRIAPTQMSWLLQHFEMLVHQLCERPSSTPLSDLTLTGSANLLQLQQWMGSPVAPLATTLHEQFRAQAQAHPDRVAIAGWDGSLTYRELEDFSTRFARDLVALNLRPGTPVGVVFDKSCWAVVALLTVLTAGGACIHLDPQHPMTRLTEIVADTGLQHILAAPQYASHPVQRLPVRHVLVVDATTARKRPSRSFAAASLPRLPVVEPTSPAYMTFTSGSTGKPKTVVIDHRAICTSIDAFTSALHLKAESRVLQFAAYTFDISYAEIFAPLLLGGTVCVLSNADRLNDLAGAMKRLGVNWACLTPTVASLVQPAEVASLLQTLVLSGEAPTEENLRTWAGQVPNLINAYGPSEASVWCAAGPFTRPDDSCTDIGVPVGCRLWIAEPDNLHRLTPLGCVGELLVEGPIMAQGYLNNTPATRAAFLSDLAWMKEVQPQPLPGFNRVYRTGDLARYLPGGRIQYLGRADTQIKVYGRRIEPREIEHHIQTHLPDTHTMVDSVTLVNRGNQKVLVAYLFQESGPMPDMELAVLARPLTPALQETLLGLQAALRAQLPHYMLPALFVPLQLLPTSAAGKTDRKLLGRVVNAMSESQRESYALQSLSRAAKRPLTSALERQLADLWATALGIDVTSIGADDSFFGLGGDSMVAMKVASLARAAQLSLTVADLFNHPVLASLAAQLSTAAFQDVSIATQDGARTLTTNPVLDLALAAALAPQVGVDVSSIAAIATTTAFQDHALVGHLTESRWMLNFFYFDGSSPSLGSSNTELEQRLRRGCDVLVQQFDILRTVFASHAGRFWQVVLHQLTPQFRVDTTSDLDTFTKQLYADGLKAENFRLSEPFVQFVLAVQPDGKHRLLMRLSHAQYDGVSLPTLWDALQRACQGENASFLPPAPLFQEFLHTGSTSSAATLAHWKSFLSGAPETRFVTYSKPALHDASRAQVLQVTRRGIPLVSMHDKSITPATVIKAAWAVLLARLAGSTDVTFGHTVANRSNSPLPGVDKVVGPCLNVVPIRARLHAGQTVLELLQALQQQQIANMPHESMGFREIIRDATHWPHWTHFSSVVQHQNIDAVDDAELVLLGDATDFTAYTPGFLGAELDLVDVSILSTPVPAARGTTVVNLDLVTSTAVMAPFAAELLLDQLVSLLRSWAALPVEKMLAYAAGDESLPALLPLAAYTDDVVEIEVPSTSDDLTKIRVVQEAVQRAWRSVLPGVDAVDDLTHDLDFFAAGGDLVQMAQLLTLLQADDELKAARGVRLEALVKCSSREKMVRLLL